jgi:hypothetical protein
MEKNNRIKLVYAYSICLVATITFLICLPGLIGSIVDLNDPLYSTHYYPYPDRPNLASFETYKMDVLRQLYHPYNQEGKQQISLYVPDDQTLKRMYEATKIDAIKEAQRNVWNSLINSLTPLIIAVLLFLFHWLWIRRLTKVSA